MNPLFPMGKSREYLIAEALLRDGASLACEALRMSSPPPKFVLACADLLARARMGETIREGFAELQSVLESKDIDQAESTAHLERIAGALVRIAKAKP